MTYDSNGNILSKSDFNGHTTSYSYDLARNLEIQRVEASGEPVARTVSTQWHSDWRLPIAQAEPKRVTRWIYNGDEGIDCAPASATVPRPDGGNQPIAVLCATIEQASGDSNGSQGLAAALSGSRRIWTYTYDEYGRMLTADGPRTDVADVTHYSYYGLDDANINRRGHIATITDALGHVTQITSYNADGQPLELLDPNGLSVALDYDARGRLIAIDAGGELTGYRYDKAGLLLRTTFPDDAYLQFSYDAAHRLTGVEDGEGNKITYTLDAMGNRTGEDVFDPGQQLVRTRSRAYDVLNRLQQDLGSSAGRVTDYEYDAEGNRTATLQPLNRSIHQTYDALNRLADVVDPLGGMTHYSYDGQNQVIGLTDPSNQTTSYTRNGFGEVIQEVSADRGATSYAYDEAGNLKTRTDARGLAVNYGYDALNRIVSIEAGDDQNKTYVWDICNNGIGRLCQLTDFANTTEYQYDLHGRVVNKTQTVGNSTLSIAYAYDADGHLTSITTPTGQTIGYRYANNRISEVSLNGQPLLTDIGYQPFGPVKSWTWRNGQPAYRGYDLDGRLTANDSGPTAAVNLAWDDADRLESASSGTEVQTFGYDDMDRVTDALGNWGRQTFAYDAVGNRLSKSEPSGLTQYGYGANNHRLDSQTGTVNRSYQYDEAGHLLNEGSLGFVYDNSGRLLGAHLSGTPISVYLHNALDQRVAKLTVNGPSVFVYDEAGRLIGDYSESRLTETIWLDDVPVALLKSQSNGSVALAGYIHTDHLGTPRNITDPSNNNVIWQWQGAPFGETAANDDPDGDGNHLAFNLRFPGQYYDTETGKHYNVHRNYDPALGRYIQSDPIGLAGGVNTYIYVENNPVNWVDPEGLWVKRCGRRLGAPGNLAVSSNQPLRHDFLSVNGEILSFQAGDNMVWSDGWVDTSENEIDDWDGDNRCETIREDNGLDQYVLAQKTYFPKYSIIAYPYTTPYILGARNCQTWVDTVLDRAREAEKKNKNQ